MYVVFHRCLCVRFTAFKVKENAVPNVLSPGLSIEAKKIAEDL